MKFVWSILLVCFGLSFLGQAAKAQQSKAVNAGVRNVSEKYRSSNSEFLRHIRAIGLADELLEPPNKKLTGIYYNSYSKLLRIKPVEYAGSYWQIGCGSVSVGRIHQGSRDFVTFGAGWAVPRCSFQTGVLKTRGLVQSGIAINGTAGGLFWPVVNTSFASYTPKGFNYFVKDGLSTESVGRGSPQLALGFSFTIRTK